MSITDSSTLSPEEILARAREALVTPARETRRIILIFTNVVVGLITLAYLVGQLLSGGLPDPTRDLLLLPGVLVSFLLSGLYNFAVISGRRPASPRLDRWSTLLTVLVFQTVCIVTVHFNPNTATAFLMDSAFSFVTLFVTGLLLGRRMAALWFIVAVASMIFAARRLGFDYVYELKHPVAGGATLEAVPLTIFLTVFLVYFSIGGAVLFIELGKVNKIIAGIPNMVDMIALAARKQQELEKENLRLSTELDVARRIQTMLLPGVQEGELFNGLRIAGRMDTAAEIGGDYYDVILKDNATYLTIGDVTDHGLSSGLVMLMAQASIKYALTEDNVDLKNSINHLNSVIHDNVRRRMRDNRNLSLSVLQYEDGMLKIAGQHECVLVFRQATENVEEIDTSDLGIYIGVQSDISRLTNVLSVSLELDDIILLYTDGLTEAENASGDQFGLERLSRSFLAHRGAPNLEETVSGIMRDVYDWMGGQELYDDITLVLAKRMQ